MYGFGTLSVFGLCPSICGKAPLFRLELILTCGCAAVSTSLINGGPRCSAADAAAVRGATRSPMSAQREQFRNARTTDAMV